MDGPVLTRWPSKKGSSTLQLNKEYFEMPTVRTNIGAEFRSSENTSIIDSAAKAGVMLPHSCKTGRCSACKCRLIAGKTRLRVDEVGLSEKEKKSGWILACAREAQTDIHLEVEDLTAYASFSVRTLPCKISHIARLTPDVVHVTLRLPPTASFTYIAGQYIEVIGHNGVRRSYSLANNFSDDQVLELHIHAVDNGCMTHYWFNEAKVGDLLRLNGPLGTFFLRKPQGREVVFLATGTGIAPVKAILESLAQALPDTLPKSTTVFWGGRRSSDFYWDMEKVPGRFNFVPVLSRPEAHWNGAMGYVQDVFLNGKRDLKNTVVYACGSPAMINSAKSLLIDHGLPAEHFFSDAFVSSGH